MEYQSGKEKVGEDWTMRGCEQSGKNLRGKSLEALEDWPPMEEFKIKKNHYLGLKEETIQ